jgi:glycosyltransferase involved in cell wall biosynthesis
VRAALLGGIISDPSVSMARYARELALALSELDQSRWQFDLTRPDYEAWLTRLWRHPRAARIDSAVARYVRYAFSLRANAADLFHILDHGYGHLVRRLDPDRTVVTCHDLIPLLSADRRIPISVPPNVVRTVRFRIKQMARASRIIADSEATRASLLQYTNIPTTRIRVVPPGVGSVFRPAQPAEKNATRARLGVDRTAPLIMQVATRGRYKNTPALFRAFASLRQRVSPRVSLVRIGEPPYDDETELATQLRMSDALRYAGRVDDAELAEWYRAADVLAFPSFWEGFGWPPLEAMACGTPVVASNIPPIREVVVDAADLVDPNDDAALASALERVISDPTHAADLRARGLRRAKELTWEQCARRTLAVYDEVCAVGRSGTGKIE